MRSGTAFAEIEVMKMFMPLRVQEDGTVRILTQPGAVLGPGDVLAELILDDPSKVRKALAFEGQLPGTLFPDLRNSRNPFFEKVPKSEKRELSSCSNVFAPKRAL